MQLLAESTIEEKLNDLCAAIASDAEVTAAREQAEAFLADEDAVALYREVAQTQHALHHKKHAGETITQGEIQTFTALRNQADAHPLVRQFSEAQETLQGIANLVNGFVTKTLEKGRVPTQEEVFSAESGCCGGGGGGGCGCSH